EATKHEKILLARHRSIEWTHLMELLDQMEAACGEYDDERLQLQLAQLVPGSAEPANAGDKVVPLKHGRE
ncbi:MAG: hypothetical protein L0Y67_08605, partial [Gammaproteobacteria bacterium]|nr:hypothetical protein [Gammaproteobacteria bacterium]